VSDDRVLDVACGPGTVASRVSWVSGANCAVSGIDINEGMLKFARADKSVKWYLGNAEDLPFEDGSFDVVLCQQGLQYFADRGKAMKEMARVLRPGGRVSLAVWGAIERQPFYLALEDGFSRFLPKARNAYDQAFSLNTADELRNIALNAGLRDARVRFEHRTIRYPSLREFVDGFMRGTKVSGLYVALPDEIQTDFVRHVTGLLEGYVDDEGLAFPLENHYLTAAR
jgi:SAM-dependent methyltransferase